MKIAIVVFFIALIDVSVVTGSTLFRDDPAGMNPNIGDLFNYEPDDFHKGNITCTH